MWKQFRKFSLRILCRNNKHSVSNRSTSYPAIFTISIFFYEMQQTPLLAYIPKNKTMLQLLSTRTYTYTITITITKTQNNKKKMFT